MSDDHMDHKSNISPTHQVSSHVVGVQVENYIVGAPCGVMDQMASSLGDEQALMAMSCQPAEVEPEVPIPPHLKFWGLDSGSLPNPMPAPCSGA